jgi:hypothetical protein
VPNFTSAGVLAVLVWEGGGAGGGGLTGGAHLLEGSRRERAGQSVADGWGRSVSGRGGRAPRGLTGAENGPR